MKLCTREEFNGEQFPVTVEQRANGLFRVSYGLEVHDNLTYEEAAQQYGECVFHALACMGKLDN